MAFYNRRVTYDELAPYVKKFRAHLRRSCSLVCEAEDPTDYYQERYIVTAKQFEYIKLTHYKEWNTLISSKFMEPVPLGNGDFFLYFYRDANGPIATVSPTHIRLPKLSNLITLCPDDFFALFRLVANAKTTQTKDALSLNPPGAGIDDLETSTLEPFFTKLRTNYRINPEYCDKKWTEREVIAFIAALDTTRDNQLSAMQYLTAHQNPDLLYFPVETAVELELDWQQVSDDYVIPPNSQS